MTCFSVVIFAFVFLMVHGESVRRVGDEKPTNFLIWGTTEYPVVENATDALTVDVTYTDGTQPMILTTTATSYNAQEDINTTSAKPENDKSQADTKPTERNAVVQPLNHEDANASVMDEVTIISTEENQLNTVSTNTSSDNEINPEEEDYENQTNVTSTNTSSYGAEQFTINPQTINDNEQIEKISNETSNATTISEAKTISNANDEINNQTNENPEQPGNQTFYVSFSSEINSDGEDYENQTNVISTNSSSVDGDNSTTSEITSDSYEDLHNNTMGSLSWNASTHQVNNISNISAHEDSANNQNQTNGTEDKESPVAKDPAKQKEESGENTNEEQPISKLDHEKSASDLVISGQTPTTTIDLVKENHQTENCEDVNKTSSLCNGVTTAGGSADNQNQTNGTRAVASPAIEKSVNQNGVSTEEEERMDDVQGPSKINISIIEQVPAKTTSTFKEVNQTENYGDGQLITREVHVEDVEKVSNISVVTGTTTDEDSANSGNQANGTGAEDNVVTDHSANQNEESGENIKKEDATSNSGPVTTKTSDTSLKEIGQTENYGDGEFITPKADFDDVSKISNTSLVNGTITDEGSANNQNQKNGTEDEKSAITADQTSQNEESTELGKRKSDEKVISRRSRDKSFIDGVSANTTNTVKEVNNTENYGDGQLKASEVHLEDEEVDNTTTNDNANVVGNKLVNETMGNKTSFENITEESASLSNETNKVGEHTTVASGNYEGATDDTTKNQFSESTTASSLESVENSGRSTTSTREPSSDTSVISSNTPATNTEVVTAAIDELPNEDEYKNISDEEEIEEQVDEKNDEPETTETISLNELISVFEKLHVGKIEELNFSIETVESLDEEISSMEDENGSTITKTTEASSSADNISTSEFTSKAQQ